ncbi:MAG: prefoldin subunit alpha [Promethearchaeota archaeon]
MIPKNENIKKLENLAAEMRYIESQVEQINTQIQLIQADINDVQVTKEKIDALQNLQDGGTTDVMVPIGSLVKLKLEIKKPEKLIINVGAGYFIEVDLEKSKEMLSGHENNLKNIKKKMEERINMFLNEAQKINAVLEKGYKDIAEKIRTGQLTGA